MEKTSAFIKTFPITWIYTAVIAAILFFAFGENGKFIAVSFVLGAVVSMMTMSMLYRSSKRVLEGDEKMAKRIAVQSYMFRYFFYALILVIAGIQENLDIFAVAAGLFSFKICLYISLFIEKKGVKKNG